MDPNPFPTRTEWPPRTMIILPRANLGEIYNYNIASVLAYIMAKVSPYIHHAQAHIIIINKYRHRNHGSNSSDKEIVAIKLW